MARLPGGPNTVPGEPACDVGEVSANRSQESDLLSRFVD